MFLKIRLVLCVLNVIYGILRWISLLIYKKPASIPPITKPIYMLSATKLAKKIREKEITSYDVVQAYIARIKEVNPFLNAVVDSRFATALIEAKNCDNQLKAGKFDVETLEKKMPLFGIPITIKQSCAVKGCSYDVGTLPRENMKADRDAAIVEMLRNAGAIPLCTTNTPELCCGFDTSNLLHGCTCNPYDTRYSAGGSSGGEGALVGAGASVIGLGSDLGGSVRIPAFLNGTFGHKSTSGIVPTDGHLPNTEDEFFQNCFSLGPLTRYAEDLDLFMKVVTSKCNRDLRLDVPVDLKQIKVYYRQSVDKSLGMLPMTAEIENCVLKAANHFKQYGVPVEKLPIEWPKTLFEITIMWYFRIKKFPQTLDENNPKSNKNIFFELIKVLFGLSQYTKQMLAFVLPVQIQSRLSKSKVSHYIKEGEKIRKNLLDLLGDNGVFIYPTGRKPCFPRHVLFEVPSFVKYCAFFNVAGFPAVHVPMGLDREGMPVGVQVIAAPYQDRLCLAVAKELEMAFGGWVPPLISINDKTPFESSFPRIKS